MPTPASRRAQFVEQFVTKGYLELIVIGVVGALIVLAHLFVSRSPESFALDLAILLAGGLTGRWPVAAGIAVALLLVPYFTFAANWPTLGEYVPLLVLFCFAVRGRRLERNWFSAIYLGELWLTQWRSMPADKSVIPYLFVWTAVVGLAWLFGSSWHAVIAGAEEARLRAALEERHELARELHDSVAASLTAVAMRAEQARLAGEANTADLDAIAADATRAVSQLGQLVNVLRRETDGATPPAPVALTDLVEAGRSRLAEKGFQPRVVWEGGEPLLPGRVAHSLGRTIEEATTNIVRHGKPGGDTSILVEVGDGVVELAFRNQSRSGRPANASPTSFGQTSMRERVSAMGGTLISSPQGDSWLTSFAIPLPSLPAEIRS